MPPAERGAAATPRFSIIAAVYDVAAYLPDFIRSVESQTFPDAAVEVIAVDDGSNDESLEILHAWQRRRPELVTVLSKPNGGQASARNLGIEHARGQWLTFTDPDDMLDRELLAEVDRFLIEEPSCEMVASRRVMFDDRTGRQWPHPLDARHFDGGDANTLRNLDQHRQHFHAHASSAFFRGSLVRSSELRFDERIRPIFEDGHFCMNYLFAAPAPQVGFVATARYLYRKRGDGSSTLDRSLEHPGRYTAVPQFGYLAVLRTALDRFGRIPEWVQNNILFDLSWYLSGEERPAESLNAAHGAIAEEFHRHLGEILALLDDTVINSFDVRPLKPAWRDILLHSYRGEDWHTPYVLVDRLDVRQKMVRVVYRYVGEPPREQFVVDGVPTAAVHQKIRDLVYFERTLLSERIAWLPFGDLQTRLDGEEVDVRLADPETTVRSMRTWTVREKYDAGYRARVRRRQMAKYQLRYRDRLFRRVMRTTFVKQRVGRAWVLIDRVHDADDSAEHLFRWLREHRPDTNAWFAIAKGTPDYKRLRSAGYRRRVVGYGSWRWKILMFHCEHLISSHADLPVHRPPDVMRLSPPPWRFTFLQHGVTKDDLSNWLNAKDIDVFLASTAAEYEAIAGDHTSYVYTSKEVALTGLPRFDRLLAEGRRIGPADRDLILIAPTWRNWLVPPAATGTSSREVDLDTYLASQFATNWTALIESADLSALAERNNLTIGVLLHPNLQSIASRIALPAHVRALRFEGTNIQRTFARARVLITDYSSIAFNSAYIDRPVVYFQFDQERVLNGGHVGRRGYYDYHRDGFGPVTDNLDDALKAIAVTVEDGPDPAPQFQERIDRTFPQRDGRCCERVADAIRDSTRVLGRTPQQTAAGDRRAAARAVASSNAVEPVSSLTVDGSEDDAEVSDVKLRD